MSEIILHQYPESLFSEKVRLLLGYKQASYSMVEIPIIMPKPDLMPLTGGYRKTPVMQIGADVYCDTALICKVIDDIYPDNSLYPESRAAVDQAFAHWTDTFFFRVCVAIAFSPRAAATNPLFQDQEAIAAFMADRAELSKGSSELQMSFEIAESHFLSHLSQLDAQLSAGSQYLGGEAPTIADFSTYHNIWFIYTREVLRDYFEPFPNLVAWYEKMVAFGHGDLQMISGADVLAAAEAAEPDEIDEGTFLGGLTSGQLVDVMPIDYGFQPVRGELLSASLDEIAIARQDDQAGRVVVHFPRIGFQVNPVS